MCCKQSTINRYLYTLYIAVNKYETITITIQNKNATCNMSINEHSAAKANLTTERITLS